ncbi:hypothetical protein HQ529_01005 [Candidatus Woesearchaeota archaeon]|nr:hypothetical protein [Candidatus Woesearchaeota archaeon]
MNDKQFNEICKKIDKIFAIIAVQSISDKDDKIYALKNLGFKNTEISPIVGLKNVRDTKGWKRK